MIYARVAGIGSYLPEKVVTNKDLEKMMDTSDEWIRERTGIKRRHIAADDETTASLGVEAAKRAMAAAGVEPEDIDLIIVGTATPTRCFRRWPVSSSVDWALEGRRLSTFTPPAAVSSTGWILRIATSGRRAPGPRS